MKNLLLIFGFFFLHSLNAQITMKQWHLQGKSSAGILDSTTYANYSFTAEVFVHDNIGLLYNFDYMNRLDNYRHIHTPLGILGGPILIASGLAKGFDGDSTNGTGFGIILGLLVLALPDGVSGHFPVAYRWDLSPYANVLGLDFIKNRTTGNTYIKYACSFGLKGSYILKDRFTLSPFIETRKTAGHSLTFGGGLGIGILLGDRSPTEEFTE